MDKRLYEFLEVNNILVENQFGFRKQNLTTHAFLQIMEQIKSSMWEGINSFDVFRDLKKALTLLTMQFF